jgi:hypothetical protein
MSDEIVINITPDPSINISAVDSNEEIALNPLTLNQGLINHSVTHQKNGSDELAHNLLGGLQGGSGNQFYHLTSGEYSNLVTGSVVRPNETGNFITNNQTGQFYANSNPSGFITGVDLSSYATQVYVTGVSGELQNQISNLNNQTGSFYLASNPSGFITGVDLSFSGNYYTKNESESRYVNTTGAETILGDKTFHDKVYINNLYVTGTETIVNTTNANVASNYLILNLTGGAVDGGLFFITGSGLTGINDSGAIIGFDHSDEFKFGIGTRASDLRALNTIAAYEQVTGISGSLQTQISTLNSATGDYALKSETGNFITNNQTGQFYANSNPSGFITGVDLSSYATTVYVTGISGGLQSQITNLDNATGSYVLNSETGSFITGIDNLVYTTGNQTISGTKNFNVRPTVSTTGVVLMSETGQFYAASNPSGYITGINNVVFTTGNQTISGTKNFNVRPTVSTTGVVLVSETGQFYGASNPSGYITGINNLVYTTGAQTIQGQKTFNTGLIIQSTANQIALKTGSAGNSIFITAPTLISANRTYTIPDVGAASAAFVLTQGPQNIDGPKAFFKKFNCLWC